jgi:hypothetical protein
VLSKLGQVRLLIFFYFKTHNLTFLYFSRRSVRILFYDRIKSFFCGSNGTNKRFRTDSFRNNLYLQHQQQNNHNYYAKQNCIDQNCNDHDGPNANYNNQNLHTNNNNNNNRYCKKNSLRQIRLK